MSGAGQTSTMRVPCRGPGAMNGAHPHEGRVVLGRVIPAASEGVRTRENGAGKNGARMTKLYEIWVGHVLAKRELAEAG